MYITENTTYAQTREKEPFDWNTFLSQEKTTKDEWERAAELASSWITCACGNQCAVIPRTVSGKPVDKELKDLGLEFMYAIDDRNKIAAKALLLTIELRSAELIKEILKDGTTNPTQE